MSSVLRASAFLIGSLLSVSVATADGAAPKPTSARAVHGAVPKPTSARAVDGAVPKPTSARAAAAPKPGNTGVVVADAGLAGSQSAATTVAKVLAQFSQTEALSAHFREEKRMSLLAQPMISEGTLHYEKPRQLARHSERPRKSSLLLQNDVLTFGDAQHSESIGLSAQPALRVLVETFVNVLAGDRAALERVAEVALEATTGGGYLIRVTPKDAGLKRLVRTMAFEGRGAQLSRMELLDANGDSTVTTFSEVQLRKPFSAAERARLFRIGG